MSLHRRCWTDHAEGLRCRQQAATPRASYHLLLSGTSCTSTRRDGGVPVSCIMTSASTTHSISSMLRPDRDGSSSMSRPVPFWSGSRARRAPTSSLRPTSNPGRPLSHHLPLWRSVRVEAGIEDVRLHDLRHTFASHAVLQGIPLPVVSRLLGHKRPSMTLRYAHVGDRETEAAAERIGAAIEHALDGRAVKSCD